MKRAKVTIPSKNQTPAKGQLFIEKSSFLYKLLHAISIICDIPNLEKDTQTDFTPEDVIEWKIRQLDKDTTTRSNEQHRISALAIEERMLRYQQDVDYRMKAEVDEQVAKFKDIELAHMRVEERKKCHSEIEKVQLDREKAVAEANEKSQSALQLEKMRLQARERVF